MNLNMAYKQRGMPYQWGAKWDLNQRNPTGPIDCSGFTRWVYFQNNILIPDGSYNQFQVTRPTTKPQPGDLGFFINPQTGKPYHVGLLYDGAFVIQARGRPYNKVIMRPRMKWEAYERFSGWRTLRNEDDEAS